MADKFAGKSGAEAARILGVNEKSFRAKLRRNGVHLSKGDKLTGAKVNAAHKSAPKKSAPKKSTRKKSTARVAKSASK